MPKDEQPMLKSDEQPAQPKIAPQKGKTKSLTEWMAECGEPIFSSMTISTAFRQWYAVRKSSYGTDYQRACDDWKSGREPKTKT